MRHWDTVIFICVALCILIGSLLTLTTTPKLWTDEAISIHIARSFETNGVLSLQTAPGIFFEAPHLIQSTGYPVTVPLAAAFKVFGFGVEEARTYMLLWLLVALAGVFFLARKLFSKQEAIYAVLLVATFASFYASGRAVVGEIPGFVLLLAGFYFLLIQKRPLLSGLLLGLAVVTKPAVFALIIPTIFFSLIFERLSFKELAKQLFTIASGMIPAAIVWVFLVIPNPFDLTTWREILLFYKNPYSGDITQNILNNLGGFFNSTTLIYFAGLFALVAFAWVLIAREKRGEGLSFLYAFVTVYSIFAFVYYLRSPGYLRYILIAELLILFVLPHAIRTVAPLILQWYRAEKIPLKIATSLVVGALVLMQGVHLFTASGISSGDSAFRVGSYLNEHFPQSTIGLLNAPIPGLFTDPSRTFLPIHLDGLSPIGKNPLLADTPPDVVVSYPSNLFIDEGRRVLEERYALFGALEGFSIYTKRY